MRWQRKDRRAGPQRSHDQRSVSVGRGGPTGGEVEPSHDRPRVGRRPIRQMSRFRSRSSVPATGRNLPGWSLLFAVVANPLMGYLTIRTGSTVIGLLSSCAIGLCSVLLVVAEAGGRSGPEDPDDPAYEDSLTRGP